MPAEVRSRYPFAADGKATWFVGSRVAKTGNGTYSGVLYQAAGPPWNLQPWNPGRVTLMPVGTLSFTFADAGSGTMSYTVGGAAQSKPITRQVFASPTTVCR